MNTRFFQIIFWIGAGCFLVGVFLPWEIQAGQDSAIVYGIQLFPTIKDHGGLELLFAFLYHMIATLKSPPPPDKAGLGYLLSALLIMVSTLYNLGSWFLRYTFHTGAGSAPALGIGLTLVLIGCVLMLAVAMTRI